MSHIMLIPQQEYWTWVRTVKEYAVHFGVQVTPRAQNALAFNRPNQTVTIVNLPGAYPEQGDIQVWFAQQDSSVKLDILDINSPEELTDLLVRRISINDPFYVPVETPVQEGFTLLWPTEYYYINQGFGENPEIYRRYDMPGHEGIDFRAPMNAKVFACSAGDVYRVDHGSTQHGYGVHVRISHPEGFKTIYAHLNQVFVSEGQPVKRGELIGLADSTGNSTGSHLHLTLKKDGASAAGQTEYPWDIVDPTPYLVKPASASGFVARSAVSVPENDWSYGKALVGVHGCYDGPMQADDWSLVKTSRVESLKLMSTANAQDVEQARAINPDMFILVRLKTNFQNRIVGPEQFVSEVKGGMTQLYNAGVRYFEIHGEPNLTMEGYGSSWQNGYQFGEWMLGVIAQLRPDFPEAKFGWPGLSPGPSVSGIRYSEREFLRSAKRLAHQADWVGCHCHWVNEEEFNDEEKGLNYEFYRGEYADKLIFITEFSNPSAHVDMQTKGEQYVRFYERVRNVPGVGAVFCFVLSAAGSYQNEVWRDETGAISPIPTLVANRTM